MARRRRPEEWDYVKEFRYTYKQTETWDQHETFVSYWCGAEGKVHQRLDYSEDFAVTLRRIAPFTWRGTGRVRSVYEVRSTIGGKLAQSGCYRGGGPMPVTVRLDPSSGLWEATGDRPKWRYRRRNTICGDVSYEDVEPGACVAVDRMPSVPPEDFRVTERERERLSLDAGMRGTKVRETEFSFVGRAVPPTLTVPAFTLTEGNRGPRLRFLSARGRSGISQRVPLWGSIELRGSEGDEVTEVELELRRHGGRNRVVVSLDPVAATRLRAPFPASGKRAFTGRLATLDAADVLRLCVNVDVPPIPPPASLTCTLRCRTARGVEAVAAVSDVVNVVCVELALRDLIDAGRNFALATFNDAAVRKGYVTKIEALSERVLADVRAGKATAEEGAHTANKLRNAVLEETRAVTSTLRRAAAKKMKRSGPSVEALIEKNVKSFGKGEFSELTPAERRALFEEIVRGSGRSRPEVTAKIPVWRAQAGALLVFTAATSAWTIWLAENKLKAVFRETVIASSSSAFAWAGGAAGLTFGPLAPFAAPAMFCVGGIAGTWLGDVAADNLAAELADWLGD